MEQVEAQTQRDAAITASPPRWRRNLAWPAGFAVAGVVLFTAYLLLTGRGTFVNSDGASNALQAWAMLHGNVLLHGWNVSDVSFYTTELPEYMLVELVRGFSPDVVHISGALTYTLLVLLAAAVAKGRDTGWPGLTRALIAAGIMLAPQYGSQLGLLMLSPDHVGTGVPLLLTWLLVDRGEQYTRNATGWRRWLVPAAVCLLLAWTAVGDELAEFIGALALVVACLTRSGWAWLRRRDRAGADYYRAGARRYELSLAAAGAVAVPLAMLGFKVIALAGGWTITPYRTGLAGASALSGHAYLTGIGILDLFGANVLAVQGGQQLAFAIIHLAGLAVAALGVLVAVRRFFGDQVLVPVLVTAIAVNIVAYLFSVQAKDVTSTREFAAVLAFSAVLAGRLVPDLITRPVPRRLLAGAGAVLLTGYAVVLGVNAATPQTTGYPAQLAAWLRAHHLSYGLAGYWQASSVTLSSQGAVLVRPISVVNEKLVLASYWEADAGWYDPAAHYANFIVNNRSAWYPDDPGPLARLMQARAGQPDHVYHVGAFTVAVWDHVNLLTRIPPPPPG